MGELELFFFSLDLSNRAKKSAYKFDFTETLQYPPTPLPPARLPVSCIESGSH